MKKLKPWLVFLGLFISHLTSGQWTLYRLNNSSSLTSALNMGSTTLLMSNSTSAWMSANSGQSWNAINYPIAIKPTLLIPGVNQVIWAGTNVSSPYWYQSVDSGRTWQSSTSGPGFPGVLDASVLPGTSFRFVCGSASLVNQLLMSRDGGLTFSTLGLPNWQGIMRRTCFLDTLTGFLGDHDGALFKTTDKGQNWQMVNMFATGMIQETSAIRFFNDSVGIVFYRSGYYFNTSDRGNTWTMGVSRLNYPADDALIVNDSVCLALSQQSPYPLSISRDQGQTFTTDSSFRTSINCKKLHRLPNGNIMILGDSGTYWLSSGILTANQTNEISFTQLDGTLYPNPGSDLINLTGIQENIPITLSVFDLGGRKIRLFPPQYQRQWLLSDLSDGLWLLQFQSPTQVKSIIWRKQ